MSSRSGRSGAAASRLPPPALPLPGGRPHRIDCSANVSLRSEVWPLPARQFTDIREGEPERGARLQEDMRLLPCRGGLWVVGGPCTARSTALWPRLCTELVATGRGLWRGSKWAGQGRLRPKPLRIWLSLLGSLVCEAGLHSPYLASPATVTRYS